MKIYQRLYCLLLGLTLVLLHNTAFEPLSASSQGWWKLVDGQSLEGWQAQDPLKHHEWHTAKSVRLAGKENRFFEATPGKGIFVNGKTGRTQNLVTLEKFGDIEVHVEFNVSHKSNSGVFLMGLYEVQVQDDFGKEDITFSMSGGFYARKINDQWIGGTPPRINACKPAGEWQTFDIKFRAPRFDTNGKKIENARFVEVRYNEHVIHENIEMEGPNSAMSPGYRSAPVPEAPKGPLMLQGDHGPVAYRNVRIRPLQ